MIALILNSGIGKRMGALTEKQPKCMTEIVWGVTIVKRQLELLAAAGVQKVVMTTGPYSEVLEAHCREAAPEMDFTFVNNPAFSETNYIYSIYLAREHLHDDVLLMHGDLVFEEAVLNSVITSKTSCMTVSSTTPLPEKDFKAVVQNGRIQKVGVEFFDYAEAAQPLYKLLQGDWTIWLDRIVQFCESGQVRCYAENALNQVTDNCLIYPMDFKDMLCAEIDNPQDLELIRSKLKGEKAVKQVYVSISTDVLHGGHINIIQEAAGLGEVTVGVLTDEVVASYKHFPILSFDERVKIAKNLKGVNRVIPQDTLSYEKNLRLLRPDFVVHGDDWVQGYQSVVREEVISILAEIGGDLVEFPYTKNAEYDVVEERVKEQLAIPDVRRGRLKKLLQLKPTLSVIEAHSGITGLLAEKTMVFDGGKSYQFDAMWISSLCDSTAKGKPDTELVDMTSRLRTINDIMEVTTKPIILDGDTGGLIEHFVYNIATLERIGVSAVIIEDKIGAKKNSLFGTDVVQTQDTIEHFCEKIRAGKRALRTKEFMLIARIESLILERGMEDALERAHAFVAAGADGIMIHSRKKDPSEIFTFCDTFRRSNRGTPLVVVPTTFNTVTEAEFAQHGINIVIYANQLIRSAFPAMQHTAELILKTHRAKEADDACMPIKEILTLIPEN